jgi:hypothetical protein
VDEAGVLLRPTLELIGELVVVDVLVAEQGRHHGLRGSGGRLILPQAAAGPGGARVRPAAQPRAQREPM